MQFGHPREEVMTSLLKRVRCKDKQTQKIMEMIHSKCKTFKKFTKTPSRPVVSHPTAIEFNEVLTMDLKEVQVQKYKYIMHMIDAYEDECQCIYQIPET